MITPQTNWFIEKALHEEEFYERFRKEADKRGIGYTEVEYIPFRGNVQYLKGLVSSRANSQTILFPYGCIEFMKWFCNIGIRDSDRINTGVNGSFFDLRRMSFEVYSSYWGQYLLNQQNVITTYAEFVRKRDFFYDILGSANTVFVRPVSNDKVFTGRVIYKDTFDQDVERMGHNVKIDYDPTMLIVVAAPRNVLKEWRFMVCENKVVTGSLYNVGGFHEEAPGCDNEKAVALAEMIAADPWQPQEAYVLDICETPDGGVHMLEIGSLNSAGWYQMDIGAILDALEAWKTRYFNMLNSEDQEIDAMVLHPD